MAFWAGWASKIGDAFFGAHTGTTGVVLSKSDGSADLWQSDGSGAANVALPTGAATEAKQDVTHTDLAAILAKIIASPATEASLAALKNCDNCVAITPSDSTVLALRVLVCLTSGTVSIKCTNDSTAVSIPMVAGQVLSCFNIVRVMAASTGTYAGGY